MYKELKTQSSDDGTKSCNYGLMILITIWITSKIQYSLKQTKEAEHKEKRYVTHVAFTFCGAMFWQMHFKQCSCDPTS